MNINTISFQVEDRKYSQLSGLRIPKSFARALQTASFWRQFISVPCEFTNFGCDDICFLAVKITACSARDWDGKDYLRIIPRVVW